MNSGEFWRRLRFAFRRRQFDRDLEEEMRFHLEMKAEQSGAAAARRQFGNVALLQEDTRRAWGWTAVDAWWDDVRYAVRALRKNPGFAVAAALTMALGIGASTAVFSVVHAVLLRPLPFREPDRIMMVWGTDEKRGDTRDVVSYEDFRDWKEQSRSFERLAVFCGDAVTRPWGDEPGQIKGSRVSGDFFAAMGVQPMIGRGFAPDEERTSAPRVTVLSYGLWQRLGGDRNMVGKTAAFGRQVFTVVGVMPRGFAFPKDSELWFPFFTDDNRNQPGTRWLRVIGRLKPGVTATQAQREMDTIAARVRQARPKYHEDAGVNVVPLREQIVGDAERALLILMGAVACVLLIACANVANLLLVRVTSRRRELALRLALGAGRWRIARCVLTESVLLATAGGAFGVAAAWFIVRAFVALDPIHLPRIEEVSVNGAVLVWSLAAAVGTGLLFGLGPALRASRPDLANWLKEGPGAPGAGERGRNRGRSILAAAQIAMAVTLLIGAGLLLRSFILRVSVPLGFRAEGMLGVELPWSTNRRIDELVERLRALPGVQSAGAATAFPQDHAGSYCDNCLEIENRGKGPGGKGRDTGLMVATPGVFAAAGMGLREGRFLSAADGPDAPKVAVINEALARRDFEREDPIGRRVRWGEEWATIVGVVGNVKGFGVAGDPMAAIYFPKGQQSWGNGVYVLVRTTAPPASLARAVRKEIRVWNKGLMILKLDTIENMLSDSVAVPRFYMTLVVAFAALAMAVSAIGVYGTVNYSVARRTHEIGVRIALGAGRRDVMTMVFGQGFWITGAGLAAGLAGAWLSTRVLETLLFGVQPTDPAAFAAGAGLLIAAVFLACYVPARRATRVDPVVALRQE